MKKSKHRQLVFLLGKSRKMLSNPAWNACALYLVRPMAGYGFTCKQRQTFLLSSHLHSPLTYLVRLPDGTVFAGSKQDGFLLYNPGIDQVSYYPSAYYKELKDNLFGAYTDSDGILWLSTGKPGVVRFDPKTGLFNHLWLSTPNENRSGYQQTTFFVFEDPFGTLWIHTREGTLFQFDRRNNQLKWFYNKPG
jgi:outer membrane protein assembly factor BamB